MSFHDLTLNEKNIVRECLKAALDGPFFPDWEFQSLFGIEREELKKIVQDWPRIDPSDEVVVSAIHNSIVNLTGYPHGKVKEWEQYISVSQDEVIKVLEKLKKES